MTVFHPKDSSRSPKPSCGLFGPGDDDDDYDISFITSKRIRESLCCRVIKS